MEISNHISFLLFIMMGMLSFLFFLGCSLLVIPKLISFLKKHNQVDTPDERKLHKEITPSSGGLLFVLIIIISIICFYSDSTSLAISLCAFILLLVGFIDDRFDLSAKIKFDLQFICTIIILTQIDPIPIFEEQYIIVNYIISFLFVVGFTNAFNLMDGVDGLAGTYALIVLIILSVFLILQNNFVWAIYTVSISAVLIAFLYYNLYPAKIFMGDTGSLFLGFTIASISLIIVNNSSTTLVNNIQNEQTYLLLFGLLFLPIIDTIRVMGIRILNKKSPFKADRNHLHHYLLKTKISTSKIPLLTSAISLFFFLESYILLALKVSSFQICIILFVTSTLVFTIITAVRLHQNIKRRMEYQVFLKNLYAKKQLLIRPQLLQTI